jgi:hypothetical protein
MVIVASIYLRFYIEVGVGVGTFLPTPRLRLHSPDMIAKLNKCRDRVVIART